MRWKQMRKRSFLQTAQCKSEIKTSCVKRPPLIQLQTHLPELQFLCNFFEQILIKIYSEIFFKI